MDNDKCKIPVKTCKILFTLLFTPLFLFSQNWVTESKSCGSCGKAVSNNAKVGDYCPHCGVRWGYENTKTSTKYVNVPSYYNSSVSVNSYAKTRKNTNLRSSATKNSSVKVVIPAYSSVYVIKRKGNWYYVSYVCPSYDYWYGYTTETLYGWVYYNLLY